MAIHHSKEILTRGSRDIEADCYTGTWGTVHFCIVHDPRPHVDKPWHLSIRRAHQEHYTEYDCVSIRQVVQRLNGLEDYFEPEAFNKMQDAATLATSRYLES